MTRCFRTLFTVKGIIQLSCTGEEHFDKHYVYFCTILNKFIIVLVDNVYVRMSNITDQHFRYASGNNSLQFQGPLGAV